MAKQYFRDEVEYCFFILFGGWVFSFGFGLGWVVVFFFFFI